MYPASRYKKRRASINPQLDRFDPNMGMFESPQGIDPDGIGGVDLTPKRLSLPEPKTPDDLPEPQVGANPGSAKQRYIERMRKQRLQGR